MALSIDWPTQVINVPRTDMLLVQSNPTEIRELDIDAFRLELKGIEASVEGIPFIDTHQHNPPITVGGVTLARVVEIINGYTVTFEDGQYAVNLAGANSNIGDVTNVNQVSVRSANSAGLTYSKEIEDQSFTDSRIWLDISGGTAGTQFPSGTPGSPVNNLADAQAIILARTLPIRLHLRGDLVLTGSDNITGYDIQGVTHEISTIDLSTSTNTGVKISACKVSGTSTGNIQIEGHSELLNISGFSGIAVESQLTGTITLAASATNEHAFIRCYSGIAGDTSPIVDCDDISAVSLTIRGYDGGIDIQNMSTSGSALSIDLNSGHATLDSTVTLGDIVVRGSGYLTDNSGVNAIVNAQGLSAGTSGLTAAESTQLGQIDTLRKLMQNRMETNPTTGVLTIYDDDDVTPFLTCNIYEDVSLAQAYRGQGLERRNRLT